MSLLEALAYSNLWVALAAALLTAAAGDALGAPASAALVAVAAGGTLFVYGVDRLRDLPRDRITSPRRSGFVERHRSWIALGAGSGAAVALAALVASPPGAVVLAGGVAALGLLHRRLKGFAFFKPAYLSGAWLAVCVGLPAVAAGPPGPEGPRLAWVVALLGGALLANAIASNVRDHEAGAARIGPERALRIARSVALLATALGVAAPAPVRPLALVPFATLAALARFRADERYGLLVVDGALVAGASAALLVS